MSKMWNRWTLLVLANVAIWCVLSFQQASTAAPQGGQQPFANAVEQRGAMVKELRQIRGLMEEQNRLLREMVKREQSNKR